MADGLNLGTGELFALAAALGWASGLRLYAVVFLTGLAGHLGWVTLPGGLQVLQQPLLLWASGAMLAVEFFADKLPWVDSAWDALHTLVRIPAGAALAMGVFGGDQQQWAVVAALLGGTLAATAHVAKAGTRAAVNASPEPFSNIGLSLLGDAAVPALLWLAWEHPVWFAVALLGAVAVAIVLIAFTLKFLRAVFRAPWAGQRPARPPRGFKSTGQAGSP
ncbi:MAG: DUF4126 domain-containing protein [Rubrivivax sp.]